MITSSTKWSFDEALYLCSLLEVLDECDLEQDKKVLNLYWFLKQKNIHAYIYEVYFNKQFIGITIDCCGDFWDSSGNGFIKRISLLNNCHHINLKKFSATVLHPSLPMKSFSDWEKVFIGNLSLINVDEHSVWINTMLLDDTNVFIKKESILTLSEIEFHQMQERFIHYLEDFSINKKYKKHFLNFFLNQVVSPVQAKRVFFYRNTYGNIRCIGLKQDNLKNQQNFIGLICMERVLRTLKPFEYREVLSLDSCFVSNTLILNDLALLGWAQYMSKEKNKLFEKAWMQIKEMEIKHSLNPSSIRLTISNRF